MLPVAQEQVPWKHVRLPEQTAWSAHWPPEQTCGVVVTPGLQRVAPFVQTAQLPAEHVPESPLTEQAVPSARTDTPQLPPEHVACRHGFVGALQCAADVHCTHEVVAPSQ